MGKSYKRNIKRNLKRRTKRMRRSCDMNVDLLYRTPCQGLPLNSAFSQSGGNQQVNNGDITSGCSSYQLDVSQPNVGGQTVVGGNPSNCLDTQMINATNFGHTTGQMGGGGAACTGYTFGLDPSQQIAGQAAVRASAPNCMYGEVAGGGRSKGKAKPKPRAKAKSRSKAKPKQAKGVSRKLSKQDNTILKNAIDNYCVRKQIKCSRKFKKDLYNIVRERLCN